MAVLIVLRVLVRKNGLKCLRKEIGMFQLLAISDICLKRAYVMCQWDGIFLAYVKLHLMYRVSLGRSVPTKCQTYRFYNWLHAFINTCYEYSLNSQCNSFGQILQVCMIMDGAKLCSSVALQDQSFSSLLCYPNMTDTLTDGQSDEEDEWCKTNDRKTTSCSLR